MRKQKSMRPLYRARAFSLSSEIERDRFIAHVRHLPLDALRPLQGVVRETPEQRTLSANAAMWVGPLKDIEQQAYVEGRRHKDIIWHEHFKELYLPEEYDPELTTEGYVKWATGIDGAPKLVGSTTWLTPKGFGIYLLQVEAFGADLGVMYRAKPNDMNRHQNASRSARR